MSVSELVGITRLRWRLVLFCAVCALLGGLYAVRGVPRRYVAHAGVLMELVKPDEETGLRIPGSMLDTYVGSQARLAVSSATTGRMVEQFGWLDDPTLQANYAAEAAHTGMTMREWLGERVAGAAGVEMLPDSNIMQLSYTSPDPDAARQLVDALRTAYIAESLNETVASSRRTLATLERMTEEARVRYVRTVEQRTRFAARYGIIVQVSGKMEARIAEIEKGMGRADPNYTQASNVPVDPETDASATPDDAENAAAAARAMLATEKSLDSKPPSVSVAYRTLQQQVEVTGETYLRLATQSEAVRDQTEATDSNLAVFGEAKAEPVPIYPNYPKIVGGSFGLGLVFGIELALLVEMLNRRVRWRHHLDALGEDDGTGHGGVIAVIGTRNAELKRFSDRVRRILGRVRLRRRVPQGA